MVTVATMITGHIDLLKGSLYMVAQLLGSIFASLLLVSTDSNYLVFDNTLRLIRGIRHTCWQVTFSALSANRWSVRDWQL